MLGFAARLLPFVLAALLFPAAPSGPIARAAAEPNVVASIGPVHSLVAGVMRGVGAPTLLVKGAGSPHTYSLRPSEATALSEADRVFWVGPGLETFLERLLGTLSPDAGVALSDAAGVRVLDSREGGSWEDHDQGHHEPHGSGHPGSRDLHVWLDPINAAFMVDAIAAELAAIDPENAARYMRNGMVLRADIGALDRELRDTLRAVRAEPYVVFHDAYQHFENRYGMNAVGSIALSPDRMPGAKRLYEIRDTLLETGARCVFAEPQFTPGILAAVIDGTAARSAVLDPLGAALDPGPDAYFTLMRTLVGSLLSCLSHPGD